MRFTLTIVLIAAIAIALSAPAARADQKECGLVGTWSGSADHEWPNTQMAWLAVHTAGAKDAKNGEMLLNFVWVGFRLLGEGSHMTPGHGVFEQIGNGQNIQYRYTWYAYVIGSEGYPLYSVRVKGIAQNTTCDTVAISYTYDMFDGIVAPHNMSSQGDYSLTGTASEFRVPMAP